MKRKLKALLIRLLRKALRRLGVEIPKVVIVKDYLHGVEVERICLKGEGKGSYPDWQAAIDLSQHLTPIIEENMKVAHTPPHLNPDFPDWRKSVLLEIFIVKKKNYE
ncbi:hypothetical protein [Dysgonomonas sp. ZJ279]|uniref:hypothetical protein n=1 Tax=Dysgonomonas sp. ZJ279 TaxID=2709796 RepID=UPI0013EDD660|nr:hypothetical protein [Dysgonomonas sp. ZJ279]